MKNKIEKLVCVNIHSKSFPLYVVIDKETDKDIVAYTVKPIIIEKKRHQHVKTGEYIKQKKVIISKKYITHITEVDTIRLKSRISSSKE